MISAVFAGRHGLEVAGMDTSMNDLISRAGASFEYERLPSEPVGSTTVTFSGVVAGLEIRVYDSSRNELAGIESCAADQSLSWSVYAPGSPNNIVQIKIIGFAYKIKDFTYTSTLGNQTIPIQLEADKWALNPP